MTAPNTTQNDTNNTTGTNGSPSTEHAREMAVQPPGNVHYDIERAARAIEATSAPDLMPHEYAQMLREGKG